MKDLLLCVHPRGVLGISSDWDDRMVTSQAKNEDPKKSLGLAVISKTIPKFQSDVLLKDIRAVSLKLKKARYLLLSRKKLEIMAVHSKLLT